MPHQLDSVAERPSEIRENKAAASSEIAGLRWQGLTVALSWFERFGLAAMYLWLAWLGFQQVRDLYLHSPAAEGVWSVQMAAFLREASLFCIQLFIGVLLLISYRPVSGPSRAVDVLLPLVTSTFFAMYSLVPFAPELLRISALPPESQVAWAGAGIALGMVGALISVWGVICLGRSFGIFVAVRQVVLHGIYRHVRHPIYLGYLFIWAGLVLVHQSVIMVLVVVVHTMLMVARARLEERRLSEVSPEYREYMQRTGFLFPLALWGHSRA